ncbi:hypothetical protein CIHG_06903, partial [Coccidioides immitis H538.4]
MSGGALGEARQKSRDHGFKKSSKIRKLNKFLKISRERPKRRKIAPTVQEAGNWGNDTFYCKARGTSGCFDMGHVVVKKTKIPALSVKGAEGKRIDCRRWLSLREIKAQSTRRKILLSEDGVFYDLTNSFQKRAIFRPPVRRSAGLCYLANRHLLVLARLGASLRKRTGSGNKVDRSCSLHFLEGMILELGITKKS